jgi:hypothetical protein
VRTIVNGQSRVNGTLIVATSLRMLERYGHVRDTEIGRAVSANADRLDQAATKTATAAKTATRTSEQ